MLLQRLRINLHQQPLHQIAMISSSTCQEGVGVLIHASQRLPPSNCAAKAHRSLRQCAHANSLSLRVQTWQSRWWSVTPMRRQLEAKLKAAPASVLLSAMSRSSLLPMTESPRTESTAKTIGTQMGSCGAVIRVHGGSRHGEGEQSRWEVGWAAAHLVSYAFFVSLWRDVSYIHAWY